MPGDDLFVATTRPRVGGADGHALCIPSIGADTIVGSRRDRFLAETIASHGVPATRFHYRGQGYFGADRDPSVAGMREDARIAAMSIGEPTAVIATRWGALVGVELAARSGAACVIVDPVLDPEGCVADTRRMVLARNLLARSDAGRSGSTPPPPRERSLAYFGQRYPASFVRDYRDGMNSALDRARDAGIDVLEVRFQDSRRGGVDAPTSWERVVVDEAANWWLIDQRSPSFTASAACVTGWLADRGVLDSGRAGVSTRVDFRSPRLAEDGTGVGVVERSGEEGIVATVEYTAHAAGPRGRVLLAAGANTPSWGNSRVWTTAARALFARGYNVSLIDTRGAGESSGEVEDPIAGDGWKDLLAALSSGPGASLLAGLCAGGRYAILAAAAMETGADVVAFFPPVRPPDERLLTALRSVATTGGRVTLVYGDRDVDLPAAVRFLDDNRRGLPSGSIELKVVPDRRLHGLANDDDARAVLDALASALGEREIES